MSAAGRSRLLRAAGALFAAALIAGCATYRHLPLPAGSNLAGVAPGGPIPLDMNRVATLAVLNNPDLNTARANLRVAQAQAFAAGLLPDPHFNLSGDHPYDHPRPGDPRYPEYDEYGLELDVDLLALMTHRSVKASTRGDYQQAQLNLLWQEWQTVAQARTLYVQQSLASERRAFLASAQQIYAAASQRSQEALAANNVTLEQSSADLAVLQDIDNRLGDAQRSLLTAQQGLRNLLGVRPDVQLPLQPLGTPDIPTRQQVQDALAQLPHRRPDLLALRAGYAAQEARVRVAVLSQFPDVSIGFTKARDNSDIHSFGGVVNLTLPLFNRGRGQVAVQSATRAQLRADYQARLDQAQGAVWQLWNEMREVSGQLAQLAVQLPQMQNNLQAAERAYRASLFPAASYLTLVGSTVTAQELQVTLQQTLWSDSIALATALGTQVQPTPPRQVHTMDAKPSASHASSAALSARPPPARGGA